MQIMSMKIYNLRKEEKQQILLIYSSAIIFCESTLQMSMGLSFLINFKCREFMEYFLVGYYDFQLEQPLPYLIWNFGVEFSLEQIPKWIPFLLQPLKSITNKLRVRPQTF